MKIKGFKIPPGTWLSDDLAEYEIKDCLGRGWEAECYTCIEAFSDGLRTIKIFESSEGLEEEMFCQYAYKLEKLNNVPGIIRFYHAGYWKKYDSWFLILENVSGQNLKAYEKKLSIFQTLKVIRQLFQTLAMAHQIGVCLGDLHSENILINGDLSTTVIDIAMEVDYSEEAVREDVFAVCQLFYELCRDTVPNDLKRIIPMENSQKASATDILGKLMGLY